MRIALSLLLMVLTSSLGFGEYDPETLHGDVRNPGIRTVVIDAGHGGKDPGCLGLHSQEKDIALKISLMLGDKISSAFPDVKVVYTRETDVFVPLNERAKLANRVGADLFISVHCNYVARRNQASGTETYIMGLHRAKDNLAVAKRENSAILLEDDYKVKYDGYDPDSDEAHIILSMYQNAHLEQSIELAHAIEETFKRSPKRKSRGVKQAGFLVLRNTAMPSVLVECGFLSHDEDEEYLKSSTGQDEVATSIFKAFKRYKERIEEKVVAQTVASTSTGVSEQGVDYFVQLTASRKELDLKQSPWDVYDNIVMKREKDYYKYLAGPFTDQSLAQRAKNKFTGDGFDGAFVVAYKGDARVEN